ncbi:MAG: molybdate ABC transporter permease subunit [Deltaproteobacteria bacterium]|nr:molybdate ABC transporter permease subunit [Deltaproteobacteria bacterium]
MNPSLVRRLLWLPSALLLALIGAPLVALLWRTGVTALGQGLANPLVGAALRTSFATSVLALVLVIALGTPLAWLLAHERGRLGSWLELLAQLPVVLPPSMAGLSLLLAFGRRGLLGPLLESLGLEIAFTQKAVVLAQVLVAAPFYLQLATAGFRGVDERYVQVARTLGSGPWRTFSRITLPLALPSILAGAALAWARALGEFGATLMFAGNLEGSTQTLPLAIYSALESDVRAAQALSVILLAVALVLLVLVRTFGPKRGAA